MNRDSKPSGGAFQVIHNSATVAGGEFFYRFVNFFSSIMVARVLGTEGYGQFSFIFTYISFFEAFVQFGLNPILIRRLSQEKGEAPQILGNAILLRIAMIVLVFPLVLWTVKALGYPLSVRQGASLAYFQLFLTLRQIYEVIFRVNLTMIYPALWNGIRALVNLVLVAIAAFYRATLPAFILAYLLSGAAGLIGLSIFSNRFVRIDFHFRKNIVLYLIKESAPLVISAYLTLISYRIDVLMLSLMKGFADVGFYSVATRITESLLVFSNAFLVSLFPILSRSFKEDRSAFDRQVSASFRAFLFMGIPIAVGGTLASKDLILFCFGPAYASSALTLSILCWHLLFSFVASLMANILIGCGRQITDMWISLSVALGNIGLNLFLIPAFSHQGAAMATVLTEMLGMFIYCFYCTKNPHIRLSLSVAEIGSPLKINVVYFFILLGLKMFLKLPVIPFIGLGVFIYGALLLSFRVVSWSDLKRYFLAAYGQKLA